MKRDPLFDVAKGLGIVFVIGIHSTNNSSRLYVNPHSAQWWVLTLINRLCDFAVPLFLLISAVLSSRSLTAKPEILPFYRRRLAGVLWPYLVWSAIYWCARFLQEPANRKMETGSLLGIHFSAPAIFLHAKGRLVELLWGKASFHLYFLVVLIELLLLLPLAVAYVRHYKPGFYGMLAVAFSVQILILFAQNRTSLLTYPASTALWYIGSLVPGAWIGLNWARFEASPRSVAVFLSLLTSLSAALYLGCQFGSNVGVHLPGALENLALTVYASCASILVLLACFRLVGIPKVVKPLELLGKNSLQVYLIHPMVMVLLAKHAVVKVLNPTTIGPLLSPLLMLAITFAVISALKVLRLDRPLFGR